MTLAEAADSLGVTAATLRQQISRRRLKATKRGRDWYITEVEVERYRREQRRDKDYPIDISPEDIERFWAKVTRSDGCWTVPASQFGYGSMVASKRQVRAHRFSWVLHNGPIPAGLRVCHHCDVQACVRPDHLFLGTDRDNALDMMSKGRNNPKPSGMPTEAEVERYRRDSLGHKGRRAK